MRNLLQITKHCCRFFGAKSQQLRPDRYCSRVEPNILKVYDEHESESFAQQIDFLRDIIIESGSAMASPESNNLRRIIELDMEAYLQNKYPNQSYIQIQNIMINFVNEMENLGIQLSAGHSALFFYTTDEFYKDFNQTFRNKDTKKLQYWNGMIRHFMHYKQQQALGRCFGKYKLPSKLYRYTNIPKNVFDDIQIAYDKKQNIIFDSFTSSSTTTDLDHFLNDNNTTIPIYFVINLENQFELLNLKEYILYSPGDYPLSLKEYSKYPLEEEWLFDIGSILSVDDIKFDICRNLYKIQLTNKMSLLYLLEKMRSYWLSIDFLENKFECDKNKLQNDVINYCQNYSNVITNQIISKYGANPQLIQQTFNDVCFWYDERDQWKDAHIKEMFKKIGKYRLWHQPKNKQLYTFIVDLPLIV